MYGWFQGPLNWVPLMPRATSVPRISSQDLAFRSEAILESSRKCVNTPPGGSVSYPLYIFSFSLYIYLLMIQKMISSVSYPLYIFSHITFLLYISFDDRKEDFGCFISYFILFYRWWDKTYTFSIFDDEKNYIKCFISLQIPKFRPILSFSDDIENKMSYNWFFIEWIIIFNQIIRPIRVLPS